MHRERNASNQYIRALSVLHWLSSVLEIVDISGHVNPNFLLLHIKGREGSARGREFLLQSARSPRP